MLNLFLSEDTLKRPLDFEFKKDTSAYRSYRISYDWEGETDYTLEIDSAACTNIYGITSSKISKKFTTQEEDYYGAILINLSNVECQMLVQVLENADEEDVLYEKIAIEDSELIFDYLSPNKYKVKVIYDENGNGEWDTGSNQDKYLPERVAYINEVKKVRSNWDNEIDWKLEADPTFTKNIVDKELEEQRRKEAEEKARQERENEQNGTNRGMRQGGALQGQSSGINRR